MAARQRLKCLVLEQEAAAALALQATFQVEILKCIYTMYIYIFIYIYIYEYVHIHIYVVYRHKYVIY